MTTMQKCLEEERKNHSRQEAKNNCRKRLGFKVKKENITLEGKNAYRQT